MKPDELIAATVAHFGGISEAQAREILRIAAFNVARCKADWTIAMPEDAELPSDRALELPSDDWGGTPIESRADDYKAVGYPAVVVANGS